jgi:hypothetical protein
MSTVNDSPASVPAPLVTPERKALYEAALEQAAACEKPRARRSRIARAAARAPGAIADPSVLPADLRRAAELLSEAPDEGGAR